MAEENSNIAEENINLSWEIRVSEGRAGTDPEAPDWEVAELENGVVKKNEDIYDNLTYAEAQQIAGMRAGLQSGQNPLKLIHRRQSYYRDFSCDFFCRST